MVFLLHPGQLLEDLEGPLALRLGREIRYSKVLECKDNEKWRSTEERVVDSPPNDGDKELPK